MKLLTALLGAVAALTGSVVTLGIFVAGAIYKMGHHAARLEALEKWRGNLRDDMHEISDKLELVALAMRELKTLVEERTERRATTRRDQP